MADDSSQLHHDIDQLKLAFGAGISLGNVLFELIPKTQSYNLVTAAIKQYLNSNSSAYQGLLVVEELAANYLGLSRAEVSEGAPAIKVLLNSSTINVYLDIYRSRFNCDRYAAFLYRRFLCGTLTSGVNIVGYFDSSSGLGEDARLVEMALQSAGVKTCRFTLSHQGDRQSTHPNGSAYTDRLRYKTSIFCISPLEVSNMTGLAASPLNEDHVNIGMLPWELPSWHQSDELSMFKEIWAISDFCYNAYKTAGCSVVNVGSPIRTEVSVSSRKTTAQFHVLTIVDAASTTTRKNPESALKAFLEAFPADQYKDCRLTVKVMNADHEFRAKMSRLRSGDRRIEFLYVNLSAKLMRRLYDSTDCYISMARSEGLGRNIAEAVMGYIPVVCARWSGVTNLLPEDYPWVVKYSLVPVEGYPKSEGQEWAEPSVQDAAAKLQSVYHCTVSDRAKICASAADELSSNRSIQAVGERYKERLNYLGLVR